MQCAVCKSETNPTLVYCQNCGAPTTADIGDILADEEKKLAERRAASALRDAQGLFFTAVALLMVVVALRLVLVKQRAYDHRPAFRPPYALVEEAALDPPATLPADALEVPIPDYDPNAPR